MAVASCSALEQIRECGFNCQAVSADIHQFSESLGNAIDAKDRFTRQHSDEVAVVAYTLALALGLPAGVADHIHIAGHLHDIGKIGIPDSVLQKPGKLDDTEWALIKQHPRMGAEIIRPVSFLASSGIVEMVYHHHERWDGRGYPDGLAGRAIPLGSRIIAVADTLSAMLQDRPYRHKMEFSRAAAEIKANAGSQFDPDVAEVFGQQSRMICRALMDVKAVS